MATRTASALWNGTLKEGKGTISTESGVLSSTPYSFSTRFEGVKAPIPKNSSARPMPAVFPWRSP